MSLGNTLLFSIIARAGWKELQASSCHDKMSCGGFCEEEGIVWLTNWIEPAPGVCVLGLKGYFHLKR